MDRTALLTALAVCCAVVAFTTAGAALAGTPFSLSVDSPGGETRATNGSGSDIDRSGGSADGRSCPTCGSLDVRSLLAGLLPGVDRRILLVVGALTVVGLALVGLRRGGRPAETRTETTDEGVTPDPARGGDGRVTVSDAPVTNDVYRAWRDMTAKVDVPDGETRTPDEYARAAVDAGLDATAVERLTALFEDVRYGTAAANEERERQAHEARESLDGGTE